MAKKKPEFSDLLTKLGSLFPGDLYIIHGKDVVEGRRSFFKNDGHYTCKLSVDAIEAVVKEYPDAEYIYISDVKKAKTEPFRYISQDPIKMEIGKAEDERERFLTNCSKIETWYTLPTDEEFIKNIFLGKEVPIIIPEYDEVEVNISKSLLPLVTQKNISELRYAVRKVENKKSVETILDVIFAMDHELFTLYMVYSYLVC